MAHLSKQLHEVLRCPVTGSALTEQDGLLVSALPGADGSRFAYRLEEGIPVLLRSEAQAAAPPALRTALPAPGPDAPPATGITTDIPAHG
jgi:uncharacterized protein YbaR (Trm112 family)